MSCSKWLLNKKGPLATVWVAAFRRVEALTRDEVASTDIVASVDKILNDVESPQRILALLLLGIVKIYSRKVEYIYLDCNKLIETERFTEPSTSTGRSMQRVQKQVKKAVRSGRRQDTTKVKESFHAVRTTEISGPISSEGFSLRTETEIIVQTSIVVREARVSVDVPAFTRPERFELDSFDLGIAEDVDDDDHHQSGRQEISLEDDRHHAPFLYESYQRATCSYAVDAACIMPEYIPLPPEVIGAIDEVNNILELSTQWHEPERENQNADSVWFTPVKDVLPPEKMETMAEVNMDKDVCTTSSILLPESQEQRISENVLENMTSASLAANYPTTTEESENGLFLGKSNPGSPVGGFQEHEIEENELLVKSNTGPPVGGFQEREAEEHETLERPVLSCKTQSITDLSPATPEPLPEGIPGPPLSPMVRTPANIEKRQGTKKRKKGFFNKDDFLPTEKKEKRPRRRLMFPMLDEVIVLPNSMVRDALTDTSDLIRRRKKAPNTYLDIWKTAKIGSLPDNLMDPLIPYQTVYLASITTVEAPESSCGEPVKARRRLSYKFSESSRSCMDAGATERETLPDEPRIRKLGEPINFESTVGCYTESGYFQDDACGRNDDIAKEKGIPVNRDESSSVVPPDDTAKEKGIPVNRDESSSVVPSDDTAKEKGIPVNRDESSSVVPSDDTAKEKGIPVNRDESSSVVPSDDTAKEKGIPVNIDESVSTPLHNEALYVALDNIDEDTPMDEENTRNEGLLSSARTRKVAGFLHQWFQDLNSKQGNNSLSLNRALEGKEKRTSALFFYETLVLKSRGLIDVNQEKPYEDIMLSRTPQFEAELQRPSSGN
ncbi:hypothetical protein EJB05_38983 [Eragrostis curvula]|uniref:Rad21/Rec8-like protein N-terminal domain-containing protein n=1 Tax=Eragrostis curvula TaxID=38414 RepID=A0A5J9TVN2_9POAL|nr:hypothetical protein EJB05_38983 [Eragrostis curvula]